MSNGLPIFMVRRRENGKKKKKKTGWFSMVNPDYEIGFVVAKPMISDILKNIP